MKLKYSHLPKTLDTKIQENYWSFYPSGAFRMLHFNVRYPVFDSWLFVGIHYYEWRNFNFSGYKINMYHARKNCLFCIFWIFAYFHTLHIFLLTLMIKQRQTDRSWGQLPILKFSFSEKPTKNLRNRPHGFEVY